MYTLLGNPIQFVCENTFREGFVKIKWSPVHRAKRIFTNKPENRAQRIFVKKVC